MLGKHQDLQEKIQSKNDCSNSESSAEYDMGALVTSESKEDLVNDVAERFELKTGSLKPKGSKRLTSIRSRESKSLEDLLQTRRHNTSSIIKRRFGSSKFYVDKSTRRTLCGPGIFSTLKILRLVLFSRRKGLKSSFLWYSAIKSCGVWI